MKYYMDIMMEGNAIPMYRYEVIASTEEEAIKKVELESGIKDCRVIIEPSYVQFSPHYGEKCKDTYKLSSFKTITK